MRLQLMQFKCKATQAKISTVFSNVSIKFSKPTSHSNTEHFVDQASNKISSKFFNDVDIFQQIQIQCRKALLNDHRLHTTPNRTRYRSDSITISIVIEIYPFADSNVIAHSIHIFFHFWRSKLSEKNYVGRRQSWFDVDLCIDHSASLQKISEGQADSFTR